MFVTIVLDTCALIWWSLDPEKLSLPAKKACSKMEKEKSGFVSSISIWEIAIKVKKQKLDIGVDLDKYVATLKKANAIRIIPVDSALWVDSVRLNWTHRDPADRVVVAMAQSHQASIITADREIRKFFSSVIW